MQEAMSTERDRQGIDRTGNCCQRRIGRWVDLDGRGLGPGVIPPPAARDPEAGDPWRCRGSGSDPRSRVSKQSRVERVGPRLWLPATSCDLP